MRSAISLALLLIAAPAAAQTPTSYQRAIAAGYKAAMYCSGIFNAGRTERQIDADELTGIYPEYDAIVPTLKAEVDRTRGVVLVPYEAGMPARISYLSNSGCTTAPIGAAPGNHYSAPRAIAPASPAPWPRGDGGIAPRPSGPLASTVGRAFDHRSYGDGAKTVGVLIVKDGTVIAERYGDGFGPFVSNRTWSVAKSIAGTIAGIAVKQGKVDPQAPARIYQWEDGGGDGGLRRSITLDQLLRMTSGLHSATAGNRTDAVYFGGTAISEETVAWPLEARPGTRFRYANNDILLAMMSVSLSLDDGGSEDYPAKLIFGPLGMNHTVAETDWAGSYVLSSQVWTTARDLARLGQFWLQDGVWAGKRLLPEGWMRYMTTPAGPQPANGPGYGATMWLFGPTQGLPEGSYAAQGNRGQYVMVIPSQRLVIVRRGEDPGAARFDIARFAADVVKALP